MQIPTEEEANNAAYHFKQVMPKVSKAVDGLSKKQLKRLLLSVIKHPLEEVIIQDDKELAMLNAMLSLINANMIVLQRAAYLKQSQEGIVNEQESS